MRLISDEFMRAPVRGGLRAPAATEEVVNQNEQVIEDQRIEEQTALQQQEEEGSWWDKAWRGALMKAEPVLTPIANAYEEYEAGLSRVMGAPAGINEATADVVSPGQALEASFSKLIGQDVRLTDAEWRESRWGTSNRNPLNDDFSVNAVSGTLDFAVDWFLDPLVILGKASKVARFGMGFTPGGLTRRGTTGKSGARVVEQVGRQVDEAIANPEATTGSVGRINAMAKALAEGDYAFALTQKEFKGANQGLLASAAANISDEQTMKIFLGAMTGSKRHIDQLAETRNDIYYAFARKVDQEKGMNLYDKMQGALKESDTPVVLEDFLEPGSNVQRRVDALMANDPEFAAMVREAEALDDAGRMLSYSGQGPVIREWGSRSRLAWQMRNSSRVKKSKAGTEAAGQERIYKDKFGTVTRIWTGFKDIAVGKTANGYVPVRGPERGRAFAEIEAAMTDSSLLRQDEVLRREALNIWGNATSPDEMYSAIRRIEVKAFRRMIGIYAERNVKVKALLDELQPEDARELYDTLYSHMNDVYKKIDRRRSTLVQTATKRNEKGYATFVDPDTGEQIVVDAVFRSQLATNEPMLHMKMLQKTAKIIVDEFSHTYAVNKARKGLAAAEEAKGLSTAVGRQQGRSSLYNAGDTALSLWKASVLLRLGYTQRNVVEGWLRSVATIGILPMVGRLPMGIVRAGRNMPRRALDTKKMQQRMARQEAEAASTITQIKEKIAFEGSTPELDEALKASEAALDKITRRRKWAADRKLTQSRVKVGDKTFLAFNDGDIYRDLTGMGQTNRNTLESAIEADREALRTTTDYKIIQPGAPQYWDELEQALVQIKSDDIGKMAIDGVPPEEALRWLRSKQAKFYRDDMRVAVSEAEGHVGQIYEIYGRYFPTEKSRELAKGSPTAGQLRGELESLGLDLSAIHGRDLQAVAMSTKGVQDKINAGLGKVFGILGDLPETHLVRQPFYATVWKREFNNRLRIAESQGVELTDEFLEGINRASKQEALRAVKETLYTIERYSTKAKLLRFIVPFFPAFENSLETWARIISRDPAVLARAGILWNVPNYYGMVVDENGDTVPYDRWDFLTGSNDKYVVMPSGIREWMGENLGMAANIPQGSFNVVAPGESPFLPGFGPLIGMPVNQVLKTKPEAQKVLRDNLPDAVYAQILPFGRANENTVDMAMPAWVRKAKQFMGKEGDAIYLGTLNGVMRDEHMRWLESGGLPEDKYTIDEVMDKTKNYYIFSMLASLTMPVSVSKDSEYSFMIGDWRKMGEDPSLTYEQRIQKFEDKWGPEAVTMITSTSETKGGVRSGMPQYEIIRDNQSLIADLVANYGEDSAGIIAAGAGAGEFDQGVYTAYGLQNVPGTTDPFREKRGAGQMQTALTMQQAWREYRNAKEARDRALEELDISYQSNAAEGIRDKWNEFKFGYMVDKYGEAWEGQIQSWEDNTANHLLTIRDVLENEKFMAEHGDEVMWQQVDDYMEMRAAAQEAVLMPDADTAAVREKWAEYQESVRYSSLLFADFFDRYLENDDLKVRV